MKVKLPEDLTAMGIDTIAQLKKANKSKKLVEVTKIFPHPVSRYVFQFPYMYVARFDSGKRTTEYFIRPDGELSRLTMSYTRV